MIRYHYKSKINKRLQEVDEYKKGSWIEIIQPTKADMDQIVELTGLKETDFKDALDDFEVPRIERINGHVILFMRIPSEEKNSIYTRTFTVIVNGNYLISICNVELSFISALLEQHSKLYTTQRSKLLLFMLIKISQQFTYQVKQIRAKVIRQKRHITEVDDNDIVNLVENEEVLNQYIAALIPLKTVIQSILGGKYVKFYKVDNELLEDLLISINQSVDVCTVNLKSIRALRDSYQIIFTNKLNRLIKVLTSATIIMTIPTIVFSAYGMNVGLPGEQSQYAFYWIMSGTFLLGVLMYLAFYFRKLL